MPRSQVDSLTNLRRNVLRETPGLQCKHLNILYLYSALAGVRGQTGALRNARMRLPVVAGGRSDLSLHFEYHAKLLRQDNYDNYNNTWDLRRLREQAVPDMNTKNATDHK